jgi:hypothetical protein
MRAKRLRTTARGAALLLVFGLTAADASAVRGLPDPKTTQPPAKEKPKPAAPASTPVDGSGVPRLIFPIVGGPVSYTDDFGDPRGSSSH